MSIHIPTEQELTDSDGKEIEYLESPDLADLAESIISKDYSRFHHLEDIAVRYLWRAEGGSSGGKNTLGKCEKMAGLKKHFARCDFAVYLSADHCRERGFDERQLEALLFHEMSHIGVEVTEKGEKYVILPHDLEFFLAEIPAHGFWSTDLQRLQQLPLFRDAVVVSHVEQHPMFVDGCQQCLEELDAELHRQHAEACEKDGVSPAVQAAAQQLRDSTQRHLRREPGLKSITISTTIDGKTEGVRITKDAVEALPQGEPHLHRHQEARYPAAICTTPDCTLEPRYPVESTETAVAGVG